MKGNLHWIEASMSENKIDSRKEGEERENTKSGGVHKESTRLKVQ